MIRKASTGDNGRNQNNTPARRDFYQSVAEVLRTARAYACRAVNFAMVEAYWNIGRMIVEEEQQGRERAEYGTALIKNLSIRLTEEFGKGYTESNLWNFRQFYLVFPGDGAGTGKLSALRRELTWTHYRILMRVGEPGCAHMVSTRGRRPELEHPRPGTADQRLYYFYHNP